MDCTQSHLNGTNTNTPAAVEREKIIEWLSPLNFFARQADIFGTRQEGTGKWLIEDPRFRDWLFGSGEMIWCFGIRRSFSVPFTSSAQFNYRAAGAGKTVLACVALFSRQSNYSNT
jgi:hypothetical protein